MPEFQPQRFLFLTLDLDTNNEVNWLTSQFGGPMLNKWLNAKTKKMPRDLL
jgi:hypothetical protein